jgi:hypothetical protein
VESTKGFPQVDSQRVVSQIWPPDWGQPMGFPKGCTSRGVPQGRWPIGGPKIGLPEGLSHGGCPETVVQYAWSGKVVSPNGDPRGGTRSVSQRELP